MTITPIIGLEVHVELKTKSKMFCGCDATHFHVDPNTHTCPVCLGLPGALPVPNKVACEWCVKLGLALGCQINKETFFERKNYFYPDLAKGYQITQLQKPFAINGQIEIDGHIIRINRAHMEEDTGKSVHVGDETLLDFNRSGVPLVEIVSEPDITSAIEAKKYLEKIQQIIRYLGISDADIEKGSMRCEPTVNVKIDNFYTPLAEIKNVASLTGVLNAIDFEINRQVEQFNLDHQEKSKTNKTTRGWDADKSVTFLQREKEGSADYRYFPEPDIPPIIFTNEDIEMLKPNKMELYEKVLEMFVNDYGLSKYDAENICDNKSFALAYQTTVQAIIGKSEFKNFSKFVANLFLGSIKQYLNKINKPYDISKLPGNYFWDLYNSVQESKISSSVAKQVIIDSYQTEKNPVDIAKEKGLMQVSDTTAIEEMAKKIIVDNPKAVADYKKNPQSLGFLIGQLMRASSGTANPELSREILEKLLK
jgi:aspartyl-tRNA(Asn)/glutamyl-tRNA(Gln) amidotransferase subunit B